MSRFAEPVVLRDLELPNRAWLAPLAGVSDVPFRRICEELGAGLCYVEMMSAVAVNYKSPRTMRMLERHESERVCGVQVTGPDAKVVGEAVGILSGEGFDTIDLNMGCPVKKIVKKGWGSAILKDPERCESIVEATVEATDKPVSAKIRLGYTQATINVEEIGMRVARAGADMLMIHGRTRADDYGAPIKYDRIAEGIAAARAQNPDIVTVGNGNVMDYASALEMSEKTDCDVVLVSRGALGNPWIFEFLLGTRCNQPTLAEWYEVVVRHLDYHEALYGSEHSSAVRFRKHLLWYVAGYPHTRRMRMRLSTVDTVPEVRAALAEYMDAHDSGERRFSNRPEGVGPADAEYDPKYDMDREADRGVGHEDPSAG